MKIKMLRDLLGVEKLGKSSGKASGDLFANAEASFNLGTVRFVGENLTNRFFPGQKIYFGNQREQIRMEGADIMVMEEKNVFAIVDEGNAE